MGMHTAMVVGGGLLLLAVMLGIGRLVSAETGMPVAARLFIPLWLVAALVNLWIGVSRAGYTLLQELPILLPVFGIPAIVALLAIWHFSRD